MRTGIRPLIAASAKWRPANRIGERVVAALLLGLWCSLPARAEVPSVTLAAGGDEPVSAAFAVTATFFADVTGLGADDLGLENGTLSGSPSWSETDVAKVYTFEGQPDDALEGQVTVNMAASAAPHASDGVTGNTQVLPLTVAVDTNGPVFTSGNSFTVSENSSSVGTLTATDGSGGVDFAITGGVDAANFAIDASTGELSFDIDGAAADFESPADDDQDNEYQLEVTATDGTGSATAQAVTVTVANALDNPGFELSPGELSIDEGGTNEFTVALIDVPTAAVTVTLRVDSNEIAALSLAAETGQLQQDGSLDLTFTTEDWDTPQTVKVEGLVDDDADDDANTINISAAGGGYDDVDEASVTATVVEPTDEGDPGIEVSKTSLSINESGDGNSGTFTVKLSTIPSGDVTVRVASSDGDKARVSADDGTTQEQTVDLTFTTENWSIEQTVTVTGVVDDDTDDETSLSISLTPSGGGYDDVTPGSVAVTVWDTNKLGVSTSKSSVKINESGDGNSDTFTVVLNVIPTGDVKVEVTSSDGDKARVSSDGGTTQGQTLELTFTTEDWSVAQTVTVIGVEDDDGNDETALSINMTPSGGGYDGAAGATVGVSVMDTSVKGLTISETDLEITESGDGNSATFTVALNTQPSSDVTVAVASSEGAAALVSADGITQADSVNLTFTSSDWETAQTVTVTGVKDDDTDDETLSISVTPSQGGYDEVAPGSVGVTVTDTTVEGLTISTESLVITEGGSDTFTVVLDLEPSAEVIVTVSTDDVDVASLSMDEVTMQSDAVELTFTTEDWNSEQGVTVTAADNSTLGNGAATLSFVISSADPAYDAMNVPDFAVTIEDDEAAALVTSTSALTMGEGDTSTFTVALGGSPSDQVTVLLGSNNAGVLTVADSSLTFDATNWSVPQTVALTAPDNEDIGGNATAEVNLRAAGAEFEGASHGVEVKIVDDDRAPPPEDTGALVSSIATSDVMGNQLGNLISDAVSGGIGPPVRTNVAPTRMRRSLFGLSAADYDPEAYNRLQVLSAREGEEGFTLVDWFSVGLSQASLDASLSGDGAFAYAMAGRELTKTSDSVTGLLYGVETSTWDYEAETDVDRTGFSLGYYSAQQSDGLTFSGSAIFTLSLNDFVSASGATGDATSQRLIFKGSISGARTMDDRRGTMKPYVSLMYASESLAAFTFSDGTTSDASTTHIGRLGLGMEYATLPTASGDRFLVRGELSQVFGADSVVLSDGDVYSPNEDPVGSVTFGWLTQPGVDTSAQIELTFGELGNSEREEIRLDGTVDRRF